MAVVMKGYPGGGSPSAMTTFTMSLATGDPDARPLAAGDLVALEVVKPAWVAGGPPGWNRDGNWFWKIIGPDEPDPVFTGQDAGVWEVTGRAFEAGTFTLGGQLESGPIGR